MTSLEGGLPDLELAARLLADLDVETPAAIEDGLDFIPERTHHKPGRKMTCRGLPELRLLATRAILLHGVPVSIDVILKEIGDVAPVRLVSALRTGFVEVGPHFWWVPDRPLPHGNWSPVILPRNVRERVSAERALEASAVAGLTVRRRG